MKIVTPRGTPGGTKTKWRAERMIDAWGKLVWTTACNCFCSQMGGSHRRRHISDGR